jgi:filamentous hemagglutinin family protein
MAARRIWSARRHRLLRMTLLAGVSAASIIAAVEPLFALDLRQVGSANAAVNAAAAAQSGAAQAAAIAAQSQQSLARAMQAIQAMQQVQAKARAAAGAGTLPNGLQPGGLVPDSGLAWINATAPTETTGPNGQAIVNIQQTAPQAVLNWSSFNVGSNTVVNFLQTSNTWAALNWIASGSPSIIKGQINAPGAVYLINQNGIIFTGSSQINIGTLIASSLNLNDPKGYENAQTSNFVNGGGLFTGTPTFQSVDNGGNPYTAGAVIVKAGAEINATGGDVLLLAPKVVNDGTISTPSGQTLMVGGNNVLLENGDSYIRGFVVCPIGGCATLTGVTADYVSSTTSGIVINNGLVEAPQGNITMVAGSIDQYGILTSTTSTTENGSITLRAETGTLTLGGATTDANNVVVSDDPLYKWFGVTGQPSLTQILPDASDTSEINDTQPIANSSIVLTGSNVDIRGIVQLQGYDITNPTVTTNVYDNPGGLTITALGTAQSSVGQVFLESGSILDTSGTTDAVASASRNSVAVELLINELEDSPVILDGPLYQLTTFYIDASVSGTYTNGQTWQGTALGNFSSWIADITRSLDERLMNGAPITIGGALIAGANAAAPVDLVQASGSVINISGGYMTYTPGFVNVSTLITSTGQLVSASNASPNISYAGVCCSFTVDHAHWGVTDTYTSPLMSSGYNQPGYIQGGAGGSLTLDVSAAALDGALYSGTVVGEKQLTAPPTFSALSINNVSPTVSAVWGTVYTTDVIDIFSDASSADTAGTTNTVYLPSSWLSSGVGDVSLAANDSIAIPAGNPIVLPVGGHFSATASQVDVESSITAPGGTITLIGAGAYVQAGTNSTLPIVVPNANQTVSAPLNGSNAPSVTIGSDVVVSAAGAWTNYFGTPSATAIAPNGGSITIESNANIYLEQGSILNVSGGGYEKSPGKVTVGNGGTLTLTAGVPLVPSSSGEEGLPVVAPQGHVYFGSQAQASAQSQSLVAGQLLGYGTAYGGQVGNGGSLAITSYDVATITGQLPGGALLTQAATGTTDDVGNSDQVLSVSTAFFSSGGFASTSLTTAGLSLPTGVTLAPTVASLAINNASAPSAISVGGIAMAVVLPVGIRPPSSITLDAAGDLWNRGGPNATGYQTQVDPADYSLNIDGNIQTDPLGSVTLTGAQLAEVSGTVTVPSGSITLNGGTYQGPLGPNPTPLLGQGVWLTQSGQLLAEGTQIFVPQSNGTVYADVLPGGDVSVSGGYVVLTPGSTINVSGTSGVSTLAAAGSSAASGNGLLASGANSYPVSSAGGTISITALVGGVVEGNLWGLSGGGNAAGGTLSVAMTAHGENANTGGPDNIWPNVENSYLILEPTLSPGSPNYFSSAQLGLPGNDLSTLPIDAQLPLSVATVSAGGFSSLILSTPAGGQAGPTGGVGFVTFAGGNTTLALPNTQIVINTGTIIVPTGSLDTIQANYFQWNNNPQANDFAEPTSGGTLSIVANLVDLVGNLAVQGGANFNVAGDLRLSTGSLVVGGDINFTANQIYPTTGATFTLASPTEIAFMANGAPPLQAPLSAGGTLNVYAPTIDQFGTLRAPTGAINLGFAASQFLDSVSGPNGPVGGVTVGATTTLLLGSGSLTSVAANDDIATIYGYVANGTDWYYSNSPNATTPTVNVWVPTPGQSSAVTANLPTKVVSLTGNGISVAAGATIDESGGGDLFGGEFVPGTGGSLNIFTGANKNFAPGANVYAIIPGYAGVTPYDPGLTTSGPSIGQQVYLSGIPGLPAGTYTLLPGQYAELPGAYLVTLNTAAGPKTVSTTRSAITPIEQADGSYLVSGYFTTPGTGTTSEHWSVFEVMSDAVANKYTEITPNYANTFFPAQAAANNVAVPRLPEDAGQLSINAVNTLTLNGSGIFNHPNGLGGIADINANQILVVDDNTAASINAFAPGSAAYEALVAQYSPGSVGPTADPDTWDPVVLSATGLSDLGVESLLLGGTRLFAFQSTVLSNGQTYTNDSNTVDVLATASAVVIANKSDPLILPDIQLVAAPETTLASITPISGSAVSVVQTVAGTGQVVIAPGAVIQASGAVAPGEPTAYTLVNGRLFNSLYNTGNSNLTYNASFFSSEISYSANDPADYYLSAAANQVGYVRVSGGGLATIIGGDANYAGLPPSPATTSTTTVNWNSLSSTTSLVTVNLTTAAPNLYAVDQEVLVTGSGGQSLVGSVTADNGTSLTLLVFSAKGSGSSTGETLSGLVNAGGSFFDNLSGFPINGAVAIGAGARLTASNSLTLFASGSGTIGANVAISAQAAELKSTQINLGTDNQTLGGLVLDQAELNVLAAVNTLEFVSSGSINLYGDVTLGGNSTSSLILDAAGVSDISSGPIGISTFAAQQVTLQNSLGGTLSSQPLTGEQLDVTALGVTTAAGTNNGQISLGTGTFTVAGFGSVFLTSTGEVIAAGDPSSGKGSLVVEAPLTINAPRISGGTLTIGSNGAPAFTPSSYTIAAEDNPTSPSTYYSVNLINSDNGSNASTVLPQALLGNSLTITGGQVTIATNVALPGGVFNVNANPGSNSDGTFNAGNIIVDAGGIIDVSGRSIQFADATATIGGGNVNLVSTSGSIVINPGAFLNVSDIAGGSSVNSTSAGTISLSAPIGGVSIASSSVGAQETLSIGTGLSFASGQSVTLTSQQNSGNYLTGTIISYNKLTGALTVAVTSASGSGAPSSWTITTPIATSATNNISISSATVGSQQTFTTTTGLALVANETIALIDKDNAGDYLIGTVSSYNSSTGALTVSVTRQSGAGTPLAWTIGLAATSTTNNVPIGTLYGAGPTAATSGSFFLDTNSLDPTSPTALMTYDQLAPILVASGFGDSWNIRAHSGDIVMSSPTLTQALNVTVSADVGNIDVAGTINASGVVSQSVGLQDSFTTAQGLSLVAGEALTLSDQSSANNTLSGTVTSYDPTTGALVVTVTSESGSGTPTDWLISSGTANIGTSTTSSVTIGNIGSNPTFTVGTGLWFFAGQTLTLKNNVGGYVTGSVTSYNPTTGALGMAVSSEVGAGLPAGWNIITGTTGTAGGQINIYAGNNLTLESSAYLNAHGATANANGVGGQVLLEADAAGNGTGILTIALNSAGQGAKIDVGVDALNSGVSAPVFGGTATMIVGSGASSASYSVTSTSSVNVTPIIANGTTYTCTTQSGLNLVAGESVSFIDGTGNTITGTVASYTASTGVLAVNVTGGNAPSIGGTVTFGTARNVSGGSAGSYTYSAGTYGNYMNLDVTGGTFANFLTGVTGESTWDGIVIAANQTYNYNIATLYLTPTTNVASNGSTQTVGFQTFLNDATSFMGGNQALNEATIWQALGLGANSNGVANGTYNAAAQMYTSGVLVNIRPGITIKNSGTITVIGDTTNEKGIDLSGSAYSGSVLNTGDSQTLDGHFGPYDEPIVLAIRAAGNLNFGTYTPPTSNTSVSSITSYLQLGSLSDGFSQYTDGLKSYNNGFGGNDVSLGAGASAWAAPFDPAAPGAYNGLSGGLGADSASYVLTAGADLGAANPLAVISGSQGTMTVAGVSGQTSTLGTIVVNGPTFQFPVVTDPLYLYNFSWSAGNVTGGTAFGTNPLPSDWTGSIAGYTPTSTTSDYTVTATIFADYASLVRTGTGNINIATSKDLVLQSPLSLIYTAGTGYNVNNTSGATNSATGIMQPLAGFTQYSGILTFAANTFNEDYLFPSTFPTHGGDLNLIVGGNIVGDMNTTSSIYRLSSTGSVLQSQTVAGNFLQDLPYDFTALGSQLKLENWITSASSLRPSIGSFNDIYATDLWMLQIPASADTFYTSGGGSAQQHFPAISPMATPGDYQLAWYTQFPYLENTIGSFGGGNITVKAGGSISNIQFVSPTNARDAGPYLVSTPYAYNPGLLTNPTDVALAQDGVAGISDPSPIYGGYSGLYVQGGGNVSLTAGGNIIGVYTYVQNGATSLQAGGSVMGAPAALNPLLQAQEPGPQIVLATATGDINVQAIGSIDIADHDAGHDIGIATTSTSNLGGTDRTVSGISLIQNASILADLVPFGSTSTKVNGDTDIMATVLTGILTSVPNGTVSLAALGNVTLDVNLDPHSSTSANTAWNTSQGILPAEVNLISLGGDVTNQGTFATYPAQNGGVNLLAEGAVILDAGFTVSDAEPSIMPTLQNIVAMLGSFQTVVTSANASTTTLPTTYNRLVGISANVSFPLGGALYLPGQDPSSSVLLGDNFAQLSPTFVQTASLETERHDCALAVDGACVQTLHAGNNNPTRIIALTGNVSQNGGIESISEQTEVYAGQDVVNLALLAQNNSPTDVTSVIAGQDVIYTGSPPPGALGTDTTIAQLQLGWTAAQPPAIEVGGPGNVLVAAGRNINLALSTGIQTFGNLLNPNLPSNNGASITIQTGLGSVALDYATFVTQFLGAPGVPPASQYAEPVLAIATGSAVGSSEVPSIPELKILLDEVFFGLLRDSDLDHNGVSASTIYVLPNTLSFDTLPQVNASYSNYQRAYAAIGALFGSSALLNTPANGGSFFGGLSTVRTQEGGNISIMAPNGQIEVGLVALPTSFPGYSVPGDPTWALNFGIVTERGGNVDLYAKGDISVDQSRIFTLEGGDMTIMSLFGNIDAGKGAKTVQAIQPPNVAYDDYGNITITPYGPASGSGIAVLRALPGVPISNVYLLTPNGTVIIDDAGLRVSGNLTVAAVAVLDAFNIQAGGKVTGVPVVQPPDFGTLVVVANTAGAAGKSLEINNDCKDKDKDGCKSDHPSVIIVEVLGYGGSDASDTPPPAKQPPKPNAEKKINYNLNSPFQVLGNGQLSEEQKNFLTADEKQKLQ